MSDNLTLKDSLKQTMQAVKKYTDNNFVSKDDYDTDLVNKLDKFKETLNTSSLNEIFVDINEQNASYEGIDVFSISEGTVQKPEGGNATYYRIPALTITNKETIVAFCDVRYDTPADNSGRISIFCRRSEDKGATWGPPIEVCRYPTNADGSATSARARSMDSTVLATSTGRLFCLNGAWKSNWNNWSTYTRIPDPDWMLKLSVSDDDGKTWTTYNLNEMPEIFDNPSQDMVAMLGGVGQGIEMYDGTLVFPVQITRIPNGERTVCATIMYSKDNGETWKVAHGLAPATDSENNVVECAPGELLMNCRGGSYRPTFKSKDLGETWEVYYEMNGLISNGAYGCQGSSTKIKLNGNEIFLHSSPINNSNSYARDKITLYASYDWKKYDLIRTYYPPAGNAEGAGYSCLATGKIKGQSCLFALYERQGNIAFRNLGLDLKQIAIRADEHFEVFDRKFETNKENLLSLLSRYTASENTLYEIIDNYLNTISTEERELMKVQLSRLGGLDIEGNVIDRQGVGYNIEGFIQSTGNTYYYDGRPENTINTERLKLSDDFTIDFDVCMLGITETAWNYLFSLNSGYNECGLGLAADGTNEWKIVYYNNSNSFIEESTVAGQVGTFIDKWVHITITKSSTDGLKVYQNNILKYEIPDAIGNLNNYPYLVIGNDKDKTKRVNGKISNFKIFGKVANSAEIKYLYDARKKEDEYIFRISQNATKIPAGLQNNVLTNIVGSRTDEFDLISIYDTGSRNTVWGTGGEVKYDLNENMIIFNKNTLNIANTDNFLSVDFSVDFDVYIDGAPGINWSQVFCIGYMYPEVPGFGLAVNETGTWNPITDGDGGPVYQDPEGTFVGRWIHITAVKSSTTGCSFYHDGQLIWNSQRDAGLQGTASMLNYPAIAIGNNTHPVKQFYGKVANFRIYDKVLSEDEIRQIYQTIGLITLRSNFSPQGQRFSDTIASNWSKQKLSVHLNLETCTSNSGENILSIGENIDSWAGNNLHFYYYAEDRRLLVQCMQGGSAQNIELFNQTGFMSIEFNSDGLTINGKQYLASNFQAIQNVLALSSTTVGSTEGSGRSNASNYSIIVKNK